MASKAVVLQVVVRLKDVPSRYPGIRNKIGLCMCVGKKRQGTEDSIFVAWKEIKIFRGANDD